MAANFETLSSEIILTILDNLERDIKTLRSFSCASQRMRDLGEKVLYRHIFFRNGYDCRKLLYNISSYPHRTTAVRSIEARCIEYDQDGLQSLGPLIAQTPNLEELIIESPLCRYEGEWQGEDGWDKTLDLILAPFELAASPIASTQLELPLRRLKKLTLHLSGGKAADGIHRCRMWVVRKTWARIFAHPNLEELSLSCAVFPPDAFKDILHFPRTQLRKLKLVECRLTHEALHDMLSLPVGLEHLYIHEEGQTSKIAEDLYEDLHPKWQLPLLHAYDNLWERNTPKVLKALQQQARTLRSLGYISELVQRLPLSDLGLRQTGSTYLSSFTALRAIKFGNPFLLSNVLLHEQISLPPNLQVYSQTLPPIGRLGSADLAHLVQMVQRMVQRVSVPEVHLYDLDPYLGDLGPEYGYSHSYAFHGNLDFVAQSFRNMGARLRFWGCRKGYSSQSYLYRSARADMRLRFDSGAADFETNGGWVDCDWEPSHLED